MVAGVVKKYGKIFIWDVTLTVATAATTATATSDDAFYGEVRKIEIDPGAALTASATIKGYEANTALATGTRDHFLDYTVPGSAVEVAFYPLVESSVTNANGALTTKLSQPHLVCDALTIDIASATAADSVRIRVWVKSD